VNWTVSIRHGCTSWIIHVRVYVVPPEPASGSAVESLTVDAARSRSRSTYAPDE
jgi:hypothetical protein